MDAYAANDKHLCLSALAKYKSGNLRAALDLKKLFMNKLLKPSTFAGLNDS